MDHGSGLPDPGIQVQKNAHVKTRLAIFDFDGTITTRDTLWEVIRYQKGELQFLRGLFLLAPTLIAYKLKFISNTRAKEAVLRHFFAGMPVADFRAACRSFQSSRLPALIRPAAWRAIRNYLEKDYRVIVVSASAADWISDWCAEAGLECVASMLESNQGRLTGMLVGRNCHGSEKVRRILELLNPKDYSEIDVYGDTSGDRPMLALGTKAFYKPFRTGRQGS
jgi:phosphatidylglycerophosphatase C